MDKIYVYGLILGVAKWSSSGGKLPSFSVRMETVLLHDSSPVHTLGAMSAQTIHRLASLPSSWGLEDFPADVFPGDYFPEIISQTYKIPVFFSFNNFWEIIATFYQTGFLSAGKISVKQVFKCFDGCFSRNSRGWDRSLKGWGYNP